jgi:hypothetical protein
VTSAAVPLWRYAAIEGTVADDRGEPVVGATVQVLRRSTASGMPRLAPAALDQTDDRGIYRVGMLVPGDYVVVLPADRGGDQTMVIGGGGGGGAMRVASFTTVSGATVREGPGGMPIIDHPEEIVGPAGLAADGAPLTFQTVFYPEASVASRAATVRLGSGEERTGVDFARRAVRSSRVTGTVMGADGPAGNQTVSLVPAGGDELAAPVGVATTQSGADGRFTFERVAPGAYTLRVTEMPRIQFGGGDETVTTQGNATFVMRSVVRVGRGGAAAPLPDEPMRWAEVPVTVEGPVDVPVALRNGMRVSGQVQFVGGGERPTADQLPSIRVSLEPADSRTSQFQAAFRGRIEANGLFRTVTVPPGRYFVRVDGLPQGWYFRGAAIGGRDVTDEPLEIQSEDIAGVTLTFTGQQTELSGSVTDPNGAEDAAALVIVFPTDRAGWINYGARPRRLRSVRVTETGTFTIAGLPPGDYYVAAVRDEAADDWQRPEFLESISAGASRLRLADGDKLTQSLRVVR